MADSLTDSWADSLIHWLTQWLTHWLNHWLTESLIDRLIEIFLTIVLYLPWLPSLRFASKMADISSSSSVVLFDDIPVSLTRIGIWYCLSKHLPDNKKNKTDQHLQKLRNFSNGITQMAIFLACQITKCYYNRSHSKKKSLWVSTCEIVGCYQADISQISVNKLNWIELKETVVYTLSKSSIHLSFIHIYHFDTLSLALWQDTCHTYKTHIRT